MSAKPDILDVTQFDSADEQLQKRQSLFDLVRQSDHFGYCEWDYRDDCLKYCSENYAEIYGLSVSAAYAQQDSFEGLVEHVHPEDREYFTHYYRTDTGPGVKTAEYRIVRTDGKVRHLRETSIAADPTAQQNDDWLVLLEDVTEYQETIRDLNIKDDLTRRVEAITEMGHYIWDMKREQYFYISEGFARLHGVSAEEYLARAQSMDEDIADVHEDDREMLKNAYSARPKKRDFVHEYRMYRADGEMRWIREQSLIVEGQENGELRLVGLMQDITARKLNEIALHEARDRLEEAVAARTGELAATVEQLRDEIEAREKIAIELENQNAELERFTYTVSHDLKAPLVTIQGFLGMLQQDVAEQNSARIDEDIARISDATSTMGRLLDELLDLSRIGRIVGDITEIDLTQTAQQASQALQSKLADGRVELSIDPMPRVYGDATRIREVFQNLIDNALKFTGTQSAPTVRVGGQIVGDEVHCFVTDNGIGIEAAYIEQIFGLFERLSTDVDGTGIGLALVKRIVEVHGGRIWAKSEGLARGTTIFFTLPIKPPTSS